MRKHWIDNLRWATVLLVLFYHVIYFYNNKGVFGGIGGFGEYPQCPQYQDVVMYILYPFFMPLLFILAGISARYALQKYSAREWFKARTRKLLVPGTIGLLVFHWMVGYFNTVVAEREGVFEGVPGVVKYFIMAFSGTGPLWFIQVLWLLCLVLLAVRALDRKDKLWTWCGKAHIVWIILLGVLFWLGEQTLVKNPRPATLDGLLNLYKPVFYLIPFLLGYFVFSHDEVQEKLGKAWIPLMACAVVAGLDSPDGLRGRRRRHPHRYHLRPGQHVAGVSRKPAELYLRLADVPRNDGLVPGEVRLYQPLRSLYDPEQLWPVYRPLPGDCEPGLYDENVHPAASVVHVRDPGGGRLYAVAAAVRNPPPDSFRPLGRAGREPEKPVLSGFFGYKTAFSA